MKNIKAKVIDKTILVCGKTFELREQLKAAGGRWDKAQKAWKFSYDPDTVELLNTWLCLRIPFPQIISEVKINDNKQDNFLLQLYSHQKKSVMLGRQTAIMADLSDPGTGKTRVQIELILERNAYPVLVICPKSIMEPVWKRQLEEVGIKPHLLNNGSAAVEKYIKKWLVSDNEFNEQVFIINYEMVPRTINDLLKIQWKYIICDESTRLKSRNAKRSRAVMKLRDVPQYRSILTGTPAPNGLLDIFNQFRWLDPRLFGENYYVFRQRYFHQKPWDQWTWYPNDNAARSITAVIQPGR